MSRRIPAIAAGAAVAFALALVATGVAAPPLSGAIFTTDASGVPVNLNLYATKEDVYLNGGPGINAPDDAGELPAGLLLPGDRPVGQDPALDRRRRMPAVHRDAAGDPGRRDPRVRARHRSGRRGRGATVQLFPYADTPNNGGVYKVWVTPVDPLNYDAPGNKTLRPGPTAKRTTRAERPDRGDRHPVLARRLEPADRGVAATWIDTNGASNVKYSE